MNWDNCTIDWTKAKVGDTITRQYNGEVEYIRNIRVIERHNSRIISPEVKVTIRSYQHSFSDTKMRGAGYGFPTDKDGNPINSQWAQRVIELQNDPRYIDEGIEHWDNTWSEPAVIRCDCGSEVELHMIMTNTCGKCGTDYNLSGQRLAPRSQWGWDTGESLDDILSADRDINDHWDEVIFDG